MDEKLKDLRGRMMDTKAVTFHDHHKQRVRSRIQHRGTPRNRKRFTTMIQEKFPVFLTYIVLLVMLTGTGLFAASENGFLPTETNTAETKKQVTPTKEELYPAIIQSLETIDSESDREQARSFTESYLTNLDNWRISDRNADFNNHSAILVQGKITEGFFDKTTFSLWVEPESGLPLEFVIRNQKSSVLEEFRLSNDTIANAYKQK